jgi:hypothetical protein
LGNILSASDNIGKEGGWQCGNVLMCQYANVAMCQF